MSEKIDRIKKHFRDNKKTYIAIGVTATVTAAVTYIIVKKNAIEIPPMDFNNHIEGDNNTILQEIHINMCRPGNKAFVVQCIEDQRVWPSIRAAAEDLNISAGKLGSHLKGKFPDVDGLHFEKVGEV